MSSNNVVVDINVLVEKIIPMTKIDEFVDKQMEIVQADLSDRKSFGKLEVLERVEIAFRDGFTLAVARCCAMTLEDMDT